MVLRDGVAVLVLSFIVSGCASAPRATERQDQKREPAAQVERGLSQVDAGEDSVKSDDSLPSYLSAKRISYASAGDAARFYYLAKPSAMNPKHTDHLVRIYVDGNQSVECRVASSVKEYRVVTNPADALGAIYVQGGVLYGAYKSGPASYGYTPRCSAGPVATDFLHNYVTKSAAGRYHFWTYRPTENEDASRAVSFFALVANPTSNLMISIGSGEYFISGRADSLELNPCFGIEGKPYRSFLAFFRNAKTQKIGWMDPSDPGMTHKNVSSKAFADIRAFMKENRISNDGKTCL